MTKKQAITATPENTTQDSQTSKENQSSNVPVPPQSGNLAAPLAGIDYESDAGTGREDFSRDDLQIPILQILQSGSPQVKKQNPKYIAGAEEGMIYHTVTKEVFTNEQGVLVIPCAYERKHVEWVPRNSGGGFVGEHPIEKNLFSKCTFDEETSKHVLPNGNHLVDTAYHFALLVDPKDNTNFTPVVITMASSQLKKSRNWNQQVSTQRMTLPNSNKRITPACFAQIWHLTTSPDSNAKGDWNVWKIEFHSFITDPVLYDAGKAFRESVLSGKATAVMPDEDYDHQDENDSSEQEETQTEPTPF